jgi:hypothetical protein
MYCLTALVYTGGFLTQYLISKDSFRFILSDMRPDLKPVMVTLTAVARVLPCLYAIFMIVPATRKTVTPERYQVFVAATYVVPVIVEQTYPLLSPQLFVITDNITATPRFQSWIEDPSLTVRQTFYHAPERPLRCGPRRPQRALPGERRPHRSRYDSVQPVAAAEHLPRA